MNIKRVIGFLAKIGIQLILYFHLVYAGYDLMEIILHFSIYRAIKHQDVYLSCIHRTELQI